MKVDIANTIVAPLQKRTIFWYIVWFFLFFIIPYFLIEMQVYIINGINSGTISPETSLFTFYTNTTHPSGSSLFLTTYIHRLQDWSHCLNNIEVYLVILILIFIFETFWLFSKENDRTERDFYISLLLFFLVFPFSISGVSLIIFRITGGTGFNGFSGIVAAFLGYFWFLLYNIYFLERGRVLQSNPQTVKIVDGFMILCFFIPILIFIFNNLLSYDNLGGHTIGYVLGFFSSFGMYLSRKKKYDKIMISLFFTIFIWITSTFWIFF
jgi:hypothetical protein